jgi:hypothetical protein
LDDWLKSGLLMPCIRLMWLSRREGRGKLGLSSVQYLQEHSGEGKGSTQTSQQAGRQLHPRLPLVAHTYNPSCQVARNDTWPSATISFPDVTAQSPTARLSVRVRGRVCPGAGQLVTGGAQAHHHHSS